MMFYFIEYVIGLVSSCQWKPLLSLCNIIRDIKISGHDYFLWAGGDINNIISAMICSRICVLDKVATSSGLGVFWKLLFKWNLHYVPDYLLHFLALSYLYNKSLNFCTKFEHKVARHPLHSILKSCCGGSHCHQVIQVPPEQLQVQPCRSGSAQLLTYILNHIRYWIFFWCSELLFTCPTNGINDVLL